MRLPGAFALVAVGLCASSARAQEPGPIGLRRTTTPIQIDGDLSDAGWKEAAVVDRFWETDPGDNVEPKVKTVAWVTYDDRYFYVAVRCDDPEPARIRALYVERDKVVGTDDKWPSSWTRATTGARPWSDG